MFCPAPGRNRWKSVLADKRALGHDRAMSKPSKPRQIAILAFPDVQSLDVTGPLEVFAGAQTLIDATGRADRGYEVLILSRDGAPLRTSSGLMIVPHASFVDTPPRLDTLIVAGGYGSREASVDPATLEWIARTSKRARRTVSVCTGAFLLAAAGLLDGRRATTHWAAAAELARRHPSVRVDPEPIFLRDGDVWTSAGVTAGMDLALALVEEDLDRDAALAIARQLVLFLRRPGNQAQFSATLASQEPEREPLRNIRRHILENLSGDLSVETLAAARPYESASLRSPIPRRDRRHTRPPRRERSPGGRPSSARGQRSAGCRRGPHLWLWHCRDDAPLLSYARLASVQLSTAAAFTPQDRPAVATTAA